MSEIALLTIGDELLIGQTVNTNASWMGMQLKLANFTVIKQVTISDSESDIVEALNYLIPQVDVVLITGGLGPTKDDITKITLADYFQTKLIRNKEIEKKIKDFFIQRKRDILEVNRMQADLPQNAKIIENKLGTASGMWFERENKIVVSMPGVPYEMKAMMTDFIIPELKNKFNPPALFHRTILTQGIGESFLADIIKDWENKLRKDNLSLAYLPSPGIVRLRISSLEGDEKKVNRYCDELKKQIGKWYFGENDDRLEIIIGNLLKEKNQTLSTAESCTGGKIAHLITSVPGSSSYYYGSVVSYDNSAKMALLNVAEDSLIEFGAVSKEVVEQMAFGGKERLKTDYCIAVSGIAGPDGGSVEKPVGTVWIAIAHPKGIFSKKYNFENDRERNIQRTCLTALNLLRKYLVNEKFD